MLIQCVSAISYFYKTSKSTTASPCYLNRLLAKHCYLNRPLATLWTFLDMFPRSEKFTFSTLGFQTKKHTNGLYTGLSRPMLFYPWHQYYRLNVAWEDRINVVWVCPFSETYPLRFWHYRYTGTYPISLWNVYHTFKRQNSILTYATLPITKHLQLHVAYCF